MRLKARLPQAEVLEALLCGCVTWSPKTADDYDRLRQVLTYDAPPMPRRAVTETRRPQPILRVCEDKSRKH